MLFKINKITNKQLIAIILFLQLAILAFAIIKISISYKQQDLYSADFDFLSSTSKQIQQIKYSCNASSNYLKELEFVTDLVSCKSLYIDYQQHIYLFENQLETLKKQATNYRESENLVGLRDSLINSSINIDSTMRLSISLNISREFERKLFLISNENSLTKTKEQNTYSEGKNSVFSYEETINQFFILQKEIEREIVSVQYKVEIIDVAINEQIKNSKIQAQTAREFDRLILIALCIIFIISVVTLAIVRKQQYKKPFDNLSDFLKQLSKGFLPKNNVELQLNNLKTIENQLNTLKEELCKLKFFAESVKAGKLDNEVVLFGGKSEIGKAITEMREHLIDIAAEQNRIAEEEQKRNWSTSGLAYFAEMQQQRSNNIEDLSDSVLRELIHYIHADVGGIYLTQEIDDEIYLELIATYAFDKKKHLLAKIEPGEGLVGTCYLERATKFLKEIPEDYLEIGSGLGHSAPMCLIVVPLIAEAKVMGVLEIAAFKILEKHEIQFIERLSESIAGYLSNAKINRRTNQLLADFTQQSNEIEAREDEMMQIIQQMQENQQLAENEKDQLLTQLDEARNIILRLEGRVKFYEQIEVSAKN